MKYSLLMSTIYYICGCFYMLFGIYTVSSNVRSSTNRLFMLMTSSMAIWSFAYAIANSAPTAEASAFWRCMSVFGWSFFHSLLLHFALILTNSRFQLDKPIKILIFYLPSFINIILFAPFGLLAEKQYEMVPSDFGWRNILPANMGQVWINVFYIVYSAAAVVLLIRWWKRMESHTPLKRQVTHFLLSIMLPFVVGTITDILPGVLGLRQSPKLTIPFLILPTTLLFITLKNFGVLIERSRTEFYPPKEDDLPEEDRLRLFETAGAIFLIGGVGSFYTGYFMAGGDLANEISIAAVVMFLGIFLRFVPHLIKSRKAQNNIFLIISIVGMSAFIIGNLSTGAMTVWTVFIIFLLYTIVLNSDIHAILFILATMITQVIIGIISPNSVAIIDNSQLLKRLFIIVLSYYAARYLNNEYAAKLKGYQRFSREQKVLETISTSFISVNSENAKEKTDKMLEMSADILGFNHAYIVEFSEDHEDATFLNICLNNAEHDLFPYYLGMKVKTAALPMAQALISKEVPITCEDFVDIADEKAQQQRNIFQTRGINSFCALPIPVNERIKAMIVVEYYERIDKNIRERQLYFLRMLANILGDAKQKTLFEDMLYDFAYFDETTKLANRNMLKKSLDQIINNRKESEKAAVIAIELENLRMINDTYGHSVGEQVMAKSAIILRSVLAESCVISRVSDATFVIVLPEVENDEKIKGCAKSLHEVFTDPLSIGTGIEALFVVIRMGIAVYPDAGRDAATLLKNADLAGYEARNSSDKIVFYSERLEGNIAENTLFTNRLFSSLQNEEFFLEFQPQISCHTGKTSGIEALLRWTSDGSKRIPPDRFIPILEQTGLIYDVGLWVLKQSLQEHKRLVAKGLPPLRVSVNLSVVQFEKDSIIPDFAKIITESGVDTKYIELEITESLFSKDPEDVLAKLHQLKEIGVSIAVDDFGSGYSSLKRLKVVPFDRVKIDKEIIDYIGLNTKTAPITEAIVTLARTFMAEITAEGVEIIEQVELLKKIGCDEIQGYYFSRPLSPEALEEFLKAEQQ